jgi:hypothetical protein
MLLADVQEPMTVLRDRPENHLPLNKETQVIMSCAIMNHVSTNSTEASHH